MNLDTLDNTAIELGLDIENFPGKWKEAKKMALAMDKRDYSEENAFQLACRLFLELGGEKIKPSLEKTLTEILKELLGTENLTIGAVPASDGLPSIKLTGVVTETKIREIFKKHGVEPRFKIAFAADPRPANKSPKDLLRNG